MSVALSLDPVTRNACPSRTCIGAAEGNKLTGGFISIDRRTGPTARGEHRQREKAKYRRRPSEHLDWNRRANDQVPGCMRDQA